VTPDDVADVAPDVLRHRLLLRPEAELERYTADDGGARRARAVPFRGDADAARRVRAGGSSRVSLLVLPVRSAVLLAVALVAARPSMPGGVRRRRGRSGTSAHLARGVSAALRLEPAEPVRVRVRQPLPPDLELDPRRRRRARRALVARGAGATRSRAGRAAHGPLGLARGRTGRRAAERARLSGPARGPAARERVRAGKFRDEGLRRRGPLGLGRSSSLFATTRRTTTSAR
jgi:hypothetical protein